MKPHIWFKNGWWHCGADRSRPSYHSKGADPKCAYDIYTVWMLE